MADITCPYGCGISFDSAQARVSERMVATSPVGQWSQTVWMCPKCQRPTIAIDAVGLRTEYIEGAPVPIETGAHIIQILWPRRSRTAPEGVPADLARTYEEAALILDDSPRSAAALARRALQQVLVDHLGATGRDLEKQVDSVIDGLPVGLAKALHALRTLGNFAAHPIKSTSTGEVVDVEPGEAEWTLDVLESLFLHVFVAPAQLRSRLDALNQKLEDAGKPTIDPETGQVQRNA